VREVRVLRAWGGVNRTGEGRSRTSWVCSGPNTRTAHSGWSAPYALRLFVTTLGTGRPTGSSTCCSGRMKAPGKHGPELEQGLERTGHSSCRHTPGSGATTRGAAGRPGFALLPLRVVGGMSAGLRLDLPLGVLQLAARPRHALRALGSR
jgi:hypothetical protein